MKPPRIFFITFLCIAITTAPGFSNYQECDKIEANAIVKDTSLGQNDGSVKIELLKVIGSRTNLKYIFCAYSDGRILNEGNFHQSNLSDLSPGQYFCIVANSDCTKKINFTIK